MLTSLGDVMCPDGCVTYCQTLSIVTIAGLLQFTQRNNSLLLLIEFLFILFLFFILHILFC